MARKMPATVGFYLSILLAFAVCVSLCKNSPVPYFDAGENLSSPNCGIWNKNSSKNTWLAYLQLEADHCTGIVVSSWDILAYQCSFQENSTEHIKVYVGECATVATYESRECINAYIEVRNVTKLTINSRDGGVLVVQLFVTKKKLPDNIIPICLFNRGSEMKTIYYSWQTYLVHGVNERKKARILNELAVGKFAPFENCFSNQSSEMKESQHYLCVHVLKRFYDMALVAFYQKRYFLRGLPVRSHLPDQDEHILHLDIVPFIDAIGEHAKEIFVLAPIPPPKPMKKFGDFENLSFPGCGTKVGAESSNKKVILPAPLVSGWDTPRHAHPWYAHISIFGEFACGGTLISKRTVLTAAHCIVQMNPEDFEVTIGMYDTNNFQPDFLGIQKNKPINLITHPKYIINQLHHDIGLMIFDQGFNITDHVRPICLWNGGSSLDNVTGKFTTVIGLGYVVNNDTYTLPDMLQEARMPIISHKECYLSNRRFFRRNLKPGDNFCAGYVNGTTACKGDSGGSLSVEKNNRWFIRGVISSGRQRKVTNKFKENITVCSLDSFSLFVDVASYMDWIVKNAPDVSFKIPEEFVSEAAPPDVSRNFYWEKFIFSLTLMCILALVLYCCKCTRSHFHPSFNTHVFQ